MKKGAKPPVQGLGLYAAGAAISIMTLIVAVNAISRYFFNSPLMQAEEIATSMFVWLIFVGASVCYKERSHIGIDCFVNFLPLKARRAVEIAVDVLLLAVNFYMTYLSWKLTLSAGSKLTPSLRMPYSVIDAAALVGFGLMSIYSVKFLIGDIRNFNAPEKIEGQEEPI
ncbi:MAG: TRAP transporter small permease [Anaerotruncus rubiinfantis]|jgi:TRAP-type C4-dicarboxylate transport system permease small subunit|uniref:TRAP transporter small permease n=1 Tax=Anaerotruncus rubiinfantis TaxID=1720200 RepID=UPI00189A7274|nr:TRAP transporter small permease [Anaerotruncus rubiinfantis]